MVAWTGVEYFKQGRFDTLDFKPRPRWPLDPKAPSASTIIADSRKK
jgi:N6-L-threonylcarbamoyladenine synthase